MLTTLDDSPWHQLPTTFDHVGTSDPRFFDRLWFAASDRVGGGALQFTMGVYQNMNVVDGGAVFIAGGRQHNLRVSRSLRPRYESNCGPLAIDVREPLKRIGLSVTPNASGISAELEWLASDPPQEERPHYARLSGRVLEDYSRYDQIGSCTGWFEAAGERHEVDSWWSCRDHSWGVRERVGIPEPVTGPPASAQGGGLFAFLFYSTPDFSGHVQVTRRAEGLNHSTVEIIDRATGVSTLGERVGLDAAFVDMDRPRRMAAATFDVHLAGGGAVRIDAEATGPAVAMQGLGYGGYNDELGLGVWRGEQFQETDVWDVTHPARVGYPDGSSGRPVHRIQPVRVRQHAADGSVSEGTGSLTFIAELPFDGERLHLDPS
ncbi:MAG TPA: hypothetical protein VHZ96_23070 [Frankiaceae bacterium]|jgi:hypothetical protein|nr:hypothetical protein [Frankiaceae bacterium]